MRWAAFASFLLCLILLNGCVPFPGGGDCDGDPGADDDSPAPADDDDTASDDDASDDDDDDDDSAADDDNDGGDDDDDNDNDNDDDNDDDIFADDDDDSGPAGVTIEQVDGGQVGQSGTSVAIAPNGDVLLAAARGRQLMIYTFRNGEKIDEEMAVWNAYAPAMALDAAGNIYLAFQDRLTRQLHVGAKRNGAWSTPVLDAAADTGESNAIAVDAAGRIHVAYRRGPINAEGELRHAEVSPNGAVRIDFVDADESPGRGIDIASDAAGRVYISYITADHVRVADNTAGAWTIEGLALADGNSQTTSIALAPDGEPWVAYARYGSLQVSRRSGGQWVWEEAGIGGTYVALAFAADGRPWIVHSDGEFNPTWTAKIDGEWQSGLLEDLDCSAGAIDAAVDLATGLHVVHHDYRNSWLKYSTGGEAAWTTQVVDNAPYAGQSCALALGADGTPHISYAMVNNGFADELRLAARRGGQWSHEVVETSSWTAQLTSLALDAAGRAHIAYGDLSAQSVQYAAQTDVGWVFETVETYAFLPALGLGAAGEAHIVYKGQGGVRYATDVSGHWAREAIQDPSWNDTGWDERLSLAMAPDDRPCVTYYDFGGVSLKFACRGNDGWLIEDVDADLYAGVQSALAFDGSGDAHVAYFDHANYHLKYARRTGGSWTNELVDGAEWSGFFPGVAVDDVGAAHVVYLAPYALPLEEDTLRYATNARGDWRCAQVDGLRNIGWENAIRVDGAGWAHVVYYSWSPATLFHAYFPAGQADEECNPALTR